MTVTYRKGTIEDSFAVFQIFLKTIMDYSARMNVMAITGGNGPEMLASLWEKRKSKFEFLAKISSEFWLGDLVEFSETSQMFMKPKEELTEAYITGRMG